MKRLLIPIIALSCSPCVAQQSVPVATNKPTVSPKFNWKLHLTKGQKWTQTSSAQGTSLQVPQGAPLDPAYGIKLDFQQTLVLQNEVLFANPKYSIVRATFTRYDQTTTFRGGGKRQSTPDRSKFTRAFVGVPLKIKLNNQGRIEAISGLQTLVAQGRKSIHSLAKSRAERANLLSLLPDSDALSHIIVNCYRLALPSTPLSVGDSYEYNFEILPSDILPRIVHVKRTLRAFDGHIAHFDDQITFNTFGQNPKIEDEIRFYNALTGNISGHTTVALPTGLSQTKLILNLKGKATQTFNNKDRATATAREITPLLSRDSVKTANPCYSEKSYATWEIDFAFGLGFT